MLLTPLRNTTATPRVLHAYLFGRFDFDEMLALQRRLVYDVSGQRSSGILLFCEHSAGISIGRSGSVGNVLLDPRELRKLGWSVRWVNRGGGCLLHMPGQIAVYPIYALDELRINIQEYLDRLHGVLVAVLRELNIDATLRPHEAGIWVGDRRIAHVGVSVRNGVTHFGCTINVEPDLKLFELVHCDGNPQPMTSIQRECRIPVRPATVRQRLITEFSASFGFDRVSLFHHHPAIAPKVPVHAVATHSR